MDKVNEFEHGIDSNTKDGVNINYVHLNPPTCTFVYIAL